MPLRIPFSRRKSSGNVFENVQTPTEPSFRVLERPQRKGTASPQGGNEFRRHIAGRPASSPLLKPLEDDATSRSRGGTHNSSSSGGHGGSSSSSARLSSSTLPSSTDADSYEDDFDGKGSQIYANLPSQSPSDPRPSFSFQAAGRTISFGSTVGNKSSSRKGSEHSLPSIPNEFTRDRAMTASSYASTAKPPKLEAGDFSLGAADFGSGFGDIFGDKRKSTVYEELEDAVVAQASIRTEFPQKLQTMRSWDTGDERRGLMSSPAHDYEPRSPAPHASARINSLFPYETNDASRSGAISAQSQLRKLYDGRGRSPDNYSMELEPPPADTIHVSRSVGRSDRTTPALQRSSEDLFDTGKPSQRSQPEESSNTSFQTLSSSAAHSRDAIASNMDSRHRLRSKKSTSPVGLLSGDAPRSTSWRADSNQSTPRATKLVLQQDSESLFDDPAIRATLSAADHFQRNTSPTKLGQPGKVLTPQQYEYYKQQREVRRSRSDATRSEESDNYEEEDEAERVRREAKQREKQAASLAVHRQQMMKLTGGTTDLSAKTAPEVRRTNQSSPIVITQADSGDRPDAGNEKSSDEDEDVPLGILAAHGFPNKNRPPSRLQQSPQANRSASQFTSYLSSPGSVAGEPAARGSIPAFARNLPKDPYFGASVVNLSSREAPAFANRASSVFGAPTPGIPPGGLVGIIAGEERARALRRGSPNPAGGYGPLPQQSMGGNMMPHNGMGSPLTGVPMPAATSMMGPSIDPTSQQYAMMQMQFQMMQMMQQMQGGSQPAHQPLPYSQSSPFLQPHQPQRQPHSRLLAPGNVQRPASMVSSGQRSTSMLNPASGQHQSWPLAHDSGYAPSVRGLGMGNGYAPSLAPSERSNIGQPSRYRPVTSKEEYGSVNDMSRTLTFASAPALVQGKNSATPPPGATIRGVEKPQASPQARLARVEDEDEDLGWEEMRKKRERKKFDWKSKRAGDGQGLKELIYGAS